MRRPMISAFEQKAMHDVDLPAPQDPAHLEEGQRVEPGPTPGDEQGVGLGLRSNSVAGSVQGAQDGSEPGPVEMLGQLHDLTLRTAIVEAPAEKQDPQAPGFAGGRCDRACRHRRSAQGRSTARLLGSSRGGEGEERAGPRLLVRQRVVALPSRKAAQASICSACPFDEYESFLRVRPEYTISL